MEQKQVSAGVLLGVRDRGRPAVLLQVRAAHDSYGGACQVTTHGKLSEAELLFNETDGVAAAISRKFREELGTVAAEMVEASKACTVDLDRTVNSKGRLVVTRGLDLGVEAGAFEKLIVPGKDVGGFRVCSDPDSIQPLEDSHRAAGVPKNETRMFRDEISAVKKFFQTFFA